MWTGERAGDGDLRAGVVAGYVLAVRGRVAVVCRGGGDGWRLAERRVKAYLGLWAVMVCAFAGLLVLAWWQGW